MNEVLLKAIEDQFHLRSIEPGLPTQFVASLRIDKTAEPWGVVLLKGGSFAPNRLCAKRLKCPELQGALQATAEQISVTRDVRLSPRREELYAVLGILGARWVSQTGVSLFLAMSLAPALSSTQ